MSAACCYIANRHYGRFMLEQLAIGFSSRWGGARPDAGRPKGTRTSGRIPHVARSPVSRHRPHHVTVKVARGTWNLRSQRGFGPIRAALAAVRGRTGFRVVHFSVQHDHVHLLLESEDRRTLANGLRSFLIRVARGLNRLMGVRGRRFPERYHEHILRTPTEVRNALRYVLRNRAIHSARWGRAVDCGADDARSSALATELVSAPETWLLREGWTRAPTVAPACAPA